MRGEAVADIKVAGRIGPNQVNKGELRASGESAIAAQPDSTDGARNDAEPEREGIELAHHHRVALSEGDAIAAIDREGTGANRLRESQGVGLNATGRATGVTVADDGGDGAGRHFAHAEVAGIRDVDVARGVDRYITRKVQASAGGRAAIARKPAGAGAGEVAEHGCGLGKVGHENFAGRGDGHVEQIARAVNRHCGGAGRGGSHEANCRSVDSP